MTRKNTAMARGIGMGVAVGCAAGIAGAVLATKNKRQIKRTATKAMRNVGNFVNSLQGNGNN